eukprot:CAMPEP_0197599896 /NCGR_PEP_ID=MMETSP1326-20131121/32287_1 /TAXON_ID=1155430 /ORGANISM="Genus nov. species nov., Strain RCC2288" /LENGTH=182 /DNA_ID=CAMNT_0043166921 /DNA_START=170 /DNA_END=715 /DNA_ORIENTATION=+
MGCAPSTPEPSDFLVPRGRSSNYLSETSGGNSNSNNNTSNSGNSIGRGSGSVNDGDGGVGSNCPLDPCDALLPGAVAPQDITWSAYHLSEPWHDSYNGSVDPTWLELKDSAERVVLFIERRTCTTTSGSGGGGSSGGSSFMPFGRGRPDGPDFGAVDHRDVTALRAPSDGTLIGCVAFTMPP